MKNHHLFNTHGFFQDVNVHNDNTCLIKHIGDKNVNLGVDMFVSVEGIVLFFFIFSKLIVKGDPKRFVRQGQNPVSSLLKLSF